MRHAWMIISHGNFEILEKQLRFLDSENADFYIHIDAKVKAFDFAYYAAIPQKSRVFYTDRIRVSWGDFSQIRCELILLEAAAAGRYDYYHLLSGVDVPVKTRSYIEHFFETHAGRNFVCFHAESLSREFSDRVKYYYPLQRLNIQNQPVRTILRRVCIAAEAPFVNRVRNYPDSFIWQKGANWVSITHALVEYILSQKDWIETTFRSSFCCDEFFIQTLVINSAFRNTLYSEEYGFDHRPCLRFIDWERGKPYTFREKDYEELISLGPDYLFARKFSYRDAPALVDRLFEYFGEDT